MSIHRISVWAILLVLGLATFNAGILLAEKPAAPAGSMVLERHTTRDPGMGNMPSHNILVPTGWQIEGGAFWAGPNLFNIYPSQDIKVTSPTGVQIHVGPSIGAIDFIPSPQGMQFGGQRPKEGTAQDGRIVLYMPGSLEEWRTYIHKKILPQAYPEARDFQVEPVVIVPELTAILQKQMTATKQHVAQFNQQNRAMGIPIQSHADGAVLAASCTYTLNNQKWELLYIFGVFYYMNDGPTGRQNYWSIEPNVAFRAPAGELEKNMPLLMTVGNSLTPTPQWARMKAEHIAKLNQIAAKGAAERSRIIADSNREISRIRNETWQARQDSLDRGHRQFINAIRGVDDYTHGNGEKVQLPHEYNHVYTNGSQYILTNDANYNPNLDQTVNNQNWDRMERAQP